MPSQQKLRLAAPALLVLLVCVFFWKLIFTGEFVWFDHPDMVYIEIPRLQFLARELHHGRFPLWDPSIWTGQSLIGQTQPGPLFPLTLLALLYPLRDGYLQFSLLNAYWVALHALAALACYALCRHWERGHAASILAALGFACGGFLGTVAWLDVAAGAIFTPLILLFLSRAVQGQRPWSSAALSGFFLGLAWLCGHHEIPLLVSLFIAAIWAVCAVRNPRTIPLAALSLTITGLIASAQLLPTIEFGRLARRWVGVTVPVGWNDPIPYHIAAGYSLPARGILQTFIPTAERYADCAPYLGVAIVALALLGIASFTANPRVRWITLGTAAALIFALGTATPVHGAIYSLIPGLGKARIPVRAIHLFNLGLCLLAAYGLDELQQRRPRAVAHALLAFGIAVAALAVANRELDDRLLLSGLFAIALAASFYCNLRPALFASVWILTALSEMHGVSTATFSSRYREDEFRFAKYLENNRDLAAFLRAESARSPIRLDVKEDELPLNFGDYHGLEVLGGYVAGVPEKLYLSELHTETSKNIFAVTHYIAKQPARPEQQSLFEAESGIKAFRNPELRLRAWSVHEAVSAGAFPELRAQLNAPNFPVYQRTVLLGETPALQSCSGDEVTITTRSANRVRLRADMRCTGMVILADSAFPGWQAAIDRQPARIWETYGVTRGVVVPAGIHEIEFAFRPRSVFTGLALFAAGSLLTLTLALLRR